MPMFRKRNTSPASRRLAELARQNCRDVVAASAVLGLREFDFFRLAYRRWFGEQPDPSVLESAFGAYMMTQRVPPWVRHLSRDVLNARRQGSLPAGAFGESAYRDRPVRHRHGPVYFSVFVVLWIAAFSLLVQIGFGAPSTAPSPVCTAAETNPVFATWLDIITGTAADPCERHPRR
jgi:hypothetical protein